MRANFKKDIYIASIKPHEEVINDYGDTLRVYDEPKPYNFNVQPLSGYAMQKEYGQTENQIQRAIIDYGRQPNEINNYTGLFKQYDLAYLDGATPDGEVKHGQNANYRIKSVRYQNKKIVLDFEKIQEGYYEIS